MVVSSDSTGPAKLQLGDSGSGVQSPGSAQEFLSGGQGGGPDKAAAEPAQREESGSPRTLDFQAFFELGESAKQKAFLLKLADALRPLADPLEIQEMAARVLAEHLAADGAGYLEVEREADGDYYLVGRAYHAPGTPSPAGRFRANDFGAFVSGTLRTGRTLAVGNIAAQGTLSEEQRAAYVGAGVSAYVAVPLIKQGRHIASITVNSATPRDWTPAEIALVEETAERTWAAVERARAEAALRESQARLEADLIATRQLQEISGALIREGNIEALYQRIVNAAATVMASDAASIQIVRPAAGRLVLLASQGFDPGSAAFWRSVTRDSGTSCGAALARGARVVIPDVEACDFTTGTRDLDQCRRVGIRAMQSTPLVSRSGCLVGMISTQWRKPHEPSQRDLQLLDVLARQAADLIERTQAEEKLRESQARLEADLIATRQLQEISGALIREGNIEALYQRIVNAAATVMASDAASFQMLHPASGRLLLLASQGFDPESATCWRFVTRDSTTTCGAALRRGARVVVPDVETCDFLKGTRDLDQARRTGLRAAQSTPLVSRSGRILGMLSTHWSTPHKPSQRDLQLFDALARQAADLIERAQAEEELRESESNLQLAIDAGSFGSWSLNLNSGELTSSSECKAQFGRRSDEAFTYEDLVAAIHPEDRILQKHAADDAIRNMAPFAVEYRCVLPDGSLRWMDMRGRHAGSDHGPPRLVGLVQDCTERNSARRRQQLLITELNHRVKNTLATIQSLTAQTLRNAKTTAEGREALEARLLALSKTHDVLTREQWEGAGLHEVVASALAAWANSGHKPRFRVEGPEVRLRPKAALALSMALHELATNAVKYGALSDEAGGVEIGWQFGSNGPRRFEFRWAERGGPPVVEPQKRGFGSRLVEEGLSHDLGGEVRLAFEEQGVVCTIQAPPDEICGGTSMSERHEHAVWGHELGSVR